jgi:serine/threonine protein kinase
MKTTLIKITDFGLANFITPKKFTTFCGSLLYGTEIHHKLNKQIHVADLRSGEVVLLQLLPFVMALRVACQDSSVE